AAGGGRRRGSAGRGAFRPREATVRSLGAMRDHDAATPRGRAPSGATSISRATHRAIGALPNA
ncbi:hypothetical protein, partial [Burkholderia pseudomallei]|uniref:hypothetical protein n=1 Tax=Burkholderia pseudomallei TaxID=28450 RepID=UPI0011787F95